MQYIKMLILLIAAFTLVSSLPTTESLITNATAFLPAAAGLSGAYDDLFTPATYNNTLKARQAGEWQSWPDINYLPDYLGASYCLYASESCKFDLVFRHNDQSLHSKVQ